MRTVICRFVIVLASMLAVAPAWCDTNPTPAQKSAAGKRIVAAPKTEAALGFKPYPGAMLELNESIEDCADAKNDRTTFIYSTADGISKVRAFYGIAPRDNNRISQPEDGRSLQLTGSESNTRIAFRLFPPKAPAPAKAASPAKAAKK